MTYSSLRFNISIRSVVSLFVMVRTKQARKLVAKTYSVEEVVNKRVRNGAVSGFAIRKLSLKCFLLIGGILFEVEGLAFLCQHLGAGA